MDLEGVDSVGPGSQVVGQAGVLSVKEKGEPQMTVNGGAAYKVESMLGFLSHSYPWHPASWLTRMQTAHKCLLSECINKDK